MKYKERDETVASLRKLADFIEEKGLELPASVDIVATIYLPYYAHKSPYGSLDDKTKKRMVKKTVQLLKPVKKTYNSYALEIERKFGKRINLRMSVSREVVCKAVPTGNKIKHAATYIPEHIEEEIEWVCKDPILKAN